MKKLIILCWVLTALSLMYVSYNYGKHQGLTTGLNLVQECTDGWTECVEGMTAEDKTWEFIDPPPDNSPSLTLDGINTGVGFTDESLELVTAGKTIIQISPSTKKIIGMDGRTIGYLNDEEAKKLEEFFLWGKP